MLAVCDARLQEISDAGRRLANTEGRTETTNAAWLVRRKEKAGSYPGPSFGHRPHAKPRHTGGLD
jgi:hypothetical protein